MIALLLLIWVGNYIEAPSWYFILAYIALVCRIISFGITMYKKGKESG